MVYQTQRAIFHLIVEIVIGKEIGYEEVSGVHAKCDPFALDGELLHKVLVQLDDWFLKKQGALESSEVHRAST